MIYRVTITLKVGILDAEGELIRKNLAGQGHRNVTNARSGQLILIEIPDGTPESVIHEMCERFLAQRGTTNWEITVEPDDSKLITPILPLPKTGGRKRKSKKKTVHTGPA